MALGKHCSKCGSRWIAGPYLMPGGKLLRFSCACGHWWTEPTPDAPGPPAWPFKTKESAP